MFPSHEIRKDFAFLLTFDQICLMWFGPNPRPYITDPTSGKRKSRPHPKYHSIRRLFKDDRRVKHFGSGCKNKRCGIPRDLVIDKLGEPQ